MGELLNELIVREDWRHWEWRKEELKQYFIMLLHLTKKEQEHIEKVLKKNEDYRKCYRMWETTEIIEIAKSLSIKSLPGTLVKELASKYPSRHTPSDEILFLMEYDKNYHEIFRDKDWKQSVKRVLRGTRKEFGTLCRLISAEPRQYTWREGKVCYEEVLKTLYDADYLEFPEQKVQVIELMLEYFFNDPDPYYKLAQILWNSSDQQFMVDYANTKKALGDVIYGLMVCDKDFPTGSSEHIQILIRLLRLMEEAGYLQEYIEDAFYGNMGIGGGIDVGGLCSFWFDRRPGKSDKKKFQALIEIIWEFDLMKDALCKLMYDFREEYETQDWIARHKSVLKSFPKGRDILKLLEEYQPPEGAAIPAEAKDSP